MGGEEVTGTGREAGLDPGHPAELGQTLLEQSRLEDAERALREAIRLRPDDAASYAGLARALLGLGRAEEAVGALREAVAYDLGNAAYHADLGRALYGLNRDEEAVAALGEAVAYEPGVAEYQGDLGQALFRAGRLGEAETALREAVRLDPDRAAYQAAFGWALLGQDRDDEAVTALREAVRLDPDSAGYQADLGRALLGLGEVPEAAAALTEAVRLSPDRAAYQASLGQALLLLDRFPEAEEAFREAADLDPGAAGYRADLGQVLLRMDRVPDAEAALRDAARLDPDPANEKIADLRTALDTALDERIVSFVMEQVDRTWAKDMVEQRGVLRTEYAEHVERITRLRLPALRVPFRSWADERQEALTQLAVSRRRLRRGGRLTALSSALFLVLGTGFLIVGFFGSKLGLSRAGQNAGLIGFIAGVLVVLVISFVATRRYLRPPVQVSQASLVLEDQLRTLVANLILEPAFTAALTITWKDAGADPVRIQDGPELSAKADIGNVVTTEAHSRLTIALNRRNGAAVGVAGPRGSGKTELARAFTELRPSDPASRTIPLMLWAPVKYDAQTFLLRLLKELCIAILATGAVTLGEAGLILTSRGRRLAVAAVAGAVAAAGIALVTLKATGTRIEPEVPYAIGGLLIASGSALLGVVLWPRRPRRRREVGISQDTISRAAELRTRAEFTETYSRSAQLGISGSGLSLSATGGTQLARLPLNEVDVVRELYNLVGSVAASGWQVVIAIDELDKMKDDAEAITFLNHVKVLFPIHDCSFVVSVSENAWARFENRGIPFTDAFDSSFDEIVHVRMLRPRESRDLLKRRNTSISDAQALLCHCLSGGLPRDLLRAIRALARMAGHLQRSGAAEPPRLGEVLGILLAEDLQEKIAAFEIESRASTRTDVSEANLDSVTRWSDLWPDPELTARRLAEARPGAAGALQADAPGSPGSLGASGASGALQPEFQAYMAVLHTIRQAFSAQGPLAELERQATGFDHDLIELGFDRVARARRSISTDVGRAWALLDEAREKLGLAPLGGAAVNR
jgi:tetratricopeptide (TPR) repeat protein